MLTHIEKNKSIEKMFLVEFKFLILSCKESLFVSLFKILNDK